MVNESNYNILENISEAFVVLDDNLVFEYFNKASEELLGRERDEVIGKYIFDAFPDFKGSILEENFIKAVKERKSLSFETFFQEGTYKNWYNVRVYSKKNGILVCFQITTNQKDFEELLNYTIDESEKLKNKLEALLEGSKSILKYKEFEDAARTIFDSCKDLIGAQSGYIALLSEDGSENEVLFLESGGLACEVDLDLPMPIRGLREEAYRKGKAVYNNNFDKSEYTKFMPPGHITLEKVLFAPLIIEGQSVGLMGIANKKADFTDEDAQTASAFGELAAIALMNSQTLEKLENSLDEKEMLLKEIHHRVKNNLMIISSLLNLQSGYLKDKESQDIFKESENRARSMALIHERLYQSTDLKKIDFGEYITSLANELFDTYVTNKSCIKLKINVDDIFIDINIAIPLGLIVNELITNSLKYAFPNGMNGEINIDFHPLDEHYEFTVEDNGIGFPKDIDYKNTESLGLQIVTNLTNQIDGNIELNRTNGTKFKITFKQLEL